MTGYQSATQLIAAILHQGKKWENLLFAQSPSTIIVLNRKIHINDYPHEKYLMAIPSSSGGKHGRPLEAEAEVPRRSGTSLDLMWYGRAARTRKNRSAGLKNQPTDFL